MVKVSFPPIVDYAKRYYFDFRAQDKTAVNRIAFDGGKYSVADTTAVSTNLTSYVTFKTYQYNTTGKPTPRKLRVRIYGYTDDAANAAYFRLIVDATDMGEVTTTSTTEVLIQDWILDIGAGSHTISIQGHGTGGYNAYLTKVYLIDCYVITSTTPITIGSFSFNPADEYTLNYKGDFKFEVGNRFKITVAYYRKTTVASTIATVDKSFSIAKADDGDTVDGASSTYYATTSLSNSAFDVKVNVGAAGDIIWIISLTLMVQVTLRGNQIDQYNYRSDWNFIINVIGVGCFHAYSKSLTGTALILNTVHRPVPGGYITELLPSASLESASHNIPLNVFEPKTIQNQYGGDIYSQSVFITLIVQVVG